MAKPNPILPPFKEEDIVRFWSKVIRQENDRCWEWQAGKLVDGYGVFYVSKKSIKAHRIAYLLHYRENPGTFCVLHTCDNPSCCNPAHLFLGTELDNVADRHAKRRDATGDKSGRRLHPERYPTGDRHPARLHPERMYRGDNHPARLHPERVARGERQGSAKLTEEKVLEIRRTYRNKEATLKQLAARYNVTFGLIGHIVNYRSWKHVP